MLLIKQEMTHFLKHTILVGEIILIFLGNKMYQSRIPLDPLFNHFQPMCQIKTLRHLDLSNQSQQSFTPQDDKRLTDLEKTLATFMNASIQANTNFENTLQSMNQSIARLETQLSQLATSLSERERERGTFPSQPVPNPRNPSNNSNHAHVVQDSNVNHMNAITTL